MEKRAVFDNPFGYEPVSPYCIRFPTTRAGDLQIMNLPGDFGANIIELKNAAESISNAVQRMGESINMFTEQNAMIVNKIANLREDVKENDDPERIYL